MRLALSLFVFTGIASCAGKAPPNVGDQPDAGGEVDAPPTSFLLSGTVMDYFGGTPVQDAQIATDGLDPALMTSSAADGSYSLDVAVGSALYVVASKTNYRPTRNVAMTVADMPVTYDAYLMTQQDVLNQYTAVGATAVHDSAPASPPPSLAATTGASAPTTRPCASSTW